MPCVTGSMNGDIEDRADRLVRLSKAAYLMVKGSIGEDLVKREELIEALQYAGNADDMDANFSADKHEILCNPSLYVCDNLLLTIHNKHDRIAMFIGCQIFILPK